jgi:ketosteroid isomerase-like protein
MGNVDVVRGMYEAFGRGDIEAVLASFDPQIEWREAESNPYEPSGKPWIGPDAIVENLFMKLAQEWDAFTVSPRDFYDAGEAVIVEGRYSGSYKATGKSIDAQFCHVIEVREGKVTSFQQYLDTARMQDAMGARLETPEAVQA